MIFGWRTFKVICDTPIFYELSNWKLGERLHAPGSLQLPTYSWEPPVVYMLLGASSCLHAPGNQLSTCSWEPPVVYLLLGASSCLHAPGSLQLSTCSWEPPVAYMLLGASSCLHDWLLQACFHHEYIHCSKCIDGVMLTASAVEAHWW